MSFFTGSFLGGEDYDPPPFPKQTLRLPFTTMGTHNVLLSPASSLNVEYNSLELL